MNNWKKVWERREDNLNIINTNDNKAVFVELKRIDGFDVEGEEIPYESLIEQHETISKMLGKYHDIKSVFDVGCGCGANLYLFMKNGLMIGGADYSEKQICIAKKVFYNDEIKELLACEAKDIPVKTKYDAVIANSVFSYFPNDAYAIEVLKKMLDKAKYSIAIIDVHDIEKKDAFIGYRRKMIKDYDEKYKGLNKLFYSRELFSHFAEDNNCNISFENSSIKGYWNNEFVFNCYIYKNEQA